jgi:futalosine hydrolase
MSGDTSLGSPTLILIPTALERRALQDAGGFPAGSALIALCGFGPVAAGARTAELLATLRPSCVVLIGIAGTYVPEDHPLGAALAFDGVMIEGIGAGSGSASLGPLALGFPQWESETGSVPIYDSLALARDCEPVARALDDRAASLLTVCAASASLDEASSRKRRHRSARAEDMEGFGVALACAIARTPLVIVRGISNVAGDRDVAHWKIGAALASARELALKILDVNSRANGADA